MVALPLGALSTAADTVEMRAPPKKGSMEKNGSMVEPCVSQGTKTNRGRQRAVIRRRASLATYRDLDQTCLR